MKISPKIPKFKQRKKAMQTLTWFYGRNWLWMTQEWRKSYLKGLKSHLMKFWNV